MKKASLCAVLLALAAALTACGEDSGKGRSPADPQKAGLDFARCMRQHGIDVKDPEPGGGVTFNVGSEDRQRLDAAQKACEHYLRGALKPPSAAKQQELLDATLKYARCMRGQGIDFPDPQQSGNGPVKIGPGQGVNPNDPAFQRADKQCRRLLPGAGGKRGMAPAPSGGSGGGGGGVRIAPGSP
jgi:hypothetical protein